MGRFNTVFKNFLSYERCSHTMALSFSFGVYIALSPFIGFHTAMAILFSWIFSLNFYVMFSVAMLINNPWSMVPVYGLGYAFGDWFLRLFGINYTYNPIMLQPLAQWVSHYTGLSALSFWGFLLGGNLLGITLAIISYPLVRRYAGLIKDKGTATVQHTMGAARKVVVNAKKVIQFSALRQAQGVRREKFNISLSDKFILNKAHFLFFPYSLSLSKGKGNNT